MYLKNLKVSIGFEGFIKIYFQARKSPQKQAVQAGMSYGLVFMD